MKPPQNRRINMAYSVWHLKSPSVVYVLYIVWKFNYIFKWTSWAFPIVSLCLLKTVLTDFRSRTSAAKMPHLWNCFLIIFQHKSDKRQDLMQILSLNKICNESHLSVKQNSGVYFWIWHFGAHKASVFTFSICSTRRCKKNLRSLLM